MVSEDLILLCGGPEDGRRVPRPSGRSLLVELAWTPMVARYRQSRDRDVFRFKEYDHVVARLGSGAFQESGNRQDGAST